MMLHSTAIPGCFGVEFTPSRDARGSFVKTFRASAFRDLGLESHFTESFFSTSREGVLHGMHFQLPPADGARFLYALAGEILDVALDLRVGSPAYGQTATFRLTDDRPLAAYLPRGVAHGFLVTRGPATLVHNLSSEYSPELDSGVLWDSFDFAWPTDVPMLSTRDRALPSFTGFASPFRFDDNEMTA
ncbi:MAG TPA: dTDP-4-dehydrorhamnose 3,5-epimerase family protein [Acidobacteriaceae bacterium]|jgi:dTDP-4-dehydrorhamnose 3,5-epimerase